MKTCELASLSHTRVKMIQPVTESITLCRVMLPHIRAVHTSVCRMRYKKKWVSLDEQISLELSAVSMLGTVRVVIACVILSFQTKVKFVGEFRDDERMLQLHRLSIC